MRRAMSRLMCVSVKRRSRWVLWFLLGRMHATIVLICPCVCRCKTPRHLDQGYRQTESCMRTCAHVLYLKIAGCLCVCLHCRRLPVHVLRRRQVLADGGSNMYRMWGGQVLANGGGDGGSNVYRMWGGEVLANGGGSNVYRMRVLVGSGAKRVRRHSAWSV